jgi:hypothetical protein
MFIIDTAVRGERKFASPHLFLVSRARQYPAFAKAVLLCILITGMLVYRRPDQFSAPYVWVEEMLVLRDFSEQGLLAVFGTVAGFQYLATRLLLVLSFQSSILHAPAINVALTVAFTCFVALNICFAPTHLRGRFFCAVATLVIPTGAEVYAVAIYTFWWAGLLAILALIWRNELAGLAFKSAPDRRINKSDNYPAGSALRRARLLRAHAIEQSSCSHCSPVCAGWRHHYAACIRKRRKSFAQDA